MNTIQKYVATSSLPVSVEEAFAYHERPGALQRLIPPWESVTIEKSDPSLGVGSRVVLTTRIAGVPVRWVAEHTEYDPPHRFADTQVAGPFESWDHRHLFEPEGVGSRLTDQIEYRMPWGAIGGLLGSQKARRTIESMFAYRHRLTRDDLTLHSDRGCPPLTVAISGSTGMIGSHLSSLLTLLGHQTRSLVRSPGIDDHAIAVWSSAAEVTKLEGIDAIVHLAGKPIADSRWTDSVKQEIRDSRVTKTRELCQRLAQLSKKPSVLVCASAIGIYGDRGDEVLTEDSSAGDDFLADVARQWEEACRPAEEAGIRVVHARFGIVLSPTGGALEKMLLPAKLAFGSLGDGKQWWSWIGLDDAIGAIYHSITDPSISGPVNFVAPEPVTNAQFAKTLGRVLGRPAILPTPAFALRITLGEMADALLLSSTRVHPKRLEQANYRFRFTQLEDLLRYSLGVERLKSA